MELEVVCCEKIEEGQIFQSEEGISDSSDLSQDSGETKKTRLSDIVKAIAEERKEITADSQDHTGQDIFSDSSFIQVKGPDYSTLFSYLEGGVKENPYTNYTRESKKEKEQEKEEVLDEGMSYKKVTEVIQNAQMKQIFGFSQEIDIRTKEQFDNFKMFNQAYIMALYRLI